MHRVVFAIGILLGAIMFVPGCQKRVNEFVIPPKFRGAIKIEPSVPDERVTVEPEIRGSTVTYVVPNTGVLKLRDARPFKSYAQIAAKYADGTPLLTGDDLTPDPNGKYRYSGDREKAIALWTLFSDDKGNLWMYVGTHQEFATAASIGSGKLAPGHRVSSRSSKGR